MSMAMRRLPRGKLFLGFLGLGLVCGFLLGALSSSRATAKSAPPSGQQNVLVVLVDGMDKSPAPLLGAWLGASTGDDGVIAWVPLYPTPLTAGEYAEAHDPVYVDLLDLQLLETLKPLRSAGVWWNEVIILDSTALSTLLSQVSPEYSLASMQPWAEPQAALHQQVSVLQTLCQGAAALNNAATLDLALGLVPEHARSSLGAFEIIARWDAFQTSGREISCQHPWTN